MQSRVSLNKRATERERPQASLMLNLAVSARGRARRSAALAISTSFSLATDAGADASGPSSALPVPTSDVTSTRLPTTRHFPSVLASAQPHGHPAFVHSSSSAGPVPSTSRMALTSVRTARRWRADLIAAKPCRSSSAPNVEQ